MVSIGMLEVFTEVAFILVSVVHVVAQIVDEVIGGGGQLEVVSPTVL